MVTEATDATRAAVLHRCQAAIPAWRGLPLDDFEFADPKGFSSFTMGVRAPEGMDPPAVLYRHLEDKENAILDRDAERQVFLLLGEHRIAAQCLHYDEVCRIEEFYDGRTLVAADLFDPQIQQGIANELYRLHQLEPTGLPDESYFTLLHRKWGPMAERILGEESEGFPPDERLLCDDLVEMLSADTLAKVQRCLPDKPTVFCHNDTYHGNVMQLTDGSVKLLDFEFSCRNHIAFDFANLFAETVMEHGLEEPPHFRINAPEFGDEDLARLIGYYLDNRESLSGTQRDEQLEMLVNETRRALLLSDYMYAMAALPLALEPIQKIRFIPYAHQRFTKFLRCWEDEFGT